MWSSTPEFYGRPRSRLLLSRAVADDDARRVLFLPGASGTGAFWQPVIERLPSHWDTATFDWPGLGNVPRDARVRTFEDLADLVLERLDAGPADLVAQSMGGAIAMRAALARPNAVRRLVLVATSGGVDLAPFDVAD